MSLLNRILFLCLIVSLASVPGFSQEDSQKKNTAQSAKEQPKTDKTNGESSGTTGLRKINTHRDRNFDIKIDEEALEAKIESAVEEAMRSVEVELGRLEIHIEPIEIDLSNLDVNIDPIVINIPDMDINIEPIEIDMEDMDIDIDIDEHDFDWDNDEDDRDHDDNDDEEDAFRSKGLNRLSVDQDKEPNKDQLKDKSSKEKDKSDKSDKKDKEKSKGLKKIN